MMMRKLARRLLALALAVLLSFVLLEVLVRVAGFDVPVVWVPDTRYGWLLLPGARRHYLEEGDGLIEVNQLGFRDRERSLAKPAGTYRIAFFGDSMTESCQVNLNQTFCYLLEEKLRSPQRPVEVLNFGVSGYAPLQELLLFQDLGPKYKPDLVVLAIFLDNDVSGSDPRLSVLHYGVPYATFDGDRMMIDYSQPQQSYDDYHKKPWYWLRTHSALYRAAVDSWWRLRLLAEDRAKHSKATGTAAEVPQRFILYQPTVPPAWQDAWSKFEKVTLAFAEEARRQGVKLLILSLPPGHVIVKSSWQTMLDQYPIMKDQTWDLDGPSRRFQEFCAQHQLPLYQPFDELAKDPGGRDLFIDGLRHLTPQGHIALARLIETRLRAELEAPPRPVETQR